MPNNKKKRSRKAGRIKAARQQQQQPMANKSPQEWCQEAERAMQSQDAEQAIALYTTALNVLSSSSSASASSGTNGTSSSSSAAAAVDPTWVLEKRAEAKVSISDPDGARLDYEQALKLVREEHAQPIQGQIPQPSPAILERMASLLLYIGQLSGGTDAVTSYQQGVALLEQSLELRRQQQPTLTNGNSPAMMDETRQQLAAAHCNAAEIYLTDLCDEPNAEQECQAHVQKALEIKVVKGSTTTANNGDNNNNDGQPIIDALQTAASLRFSQCRGLEAVDYIQQCYQRIQAACEALCQLVGMYIPSTPIQPGAAAAAPPPPQEQQQQQQAMELTQLEAVQSLPGFEFRCQTAKLLLEACACLMEQQQQSPSQQSSTLSPPQECARAAIHVLGSLMAENDEVIEIWCLLGDAFRYLQHPATAAQYYQTSRDMLQQVRKSLEQELDQARNDEEEQELQQQVDEITLQLEDVQQKLEEMGNEGDENGAEPMEE